MREVHIMADLLVVKAKIKDVIGDYNVASDFADELDKIVRHQVQLAAKRAEANGRRTVMAKDL
jgi:histone H3/H4